MPRWLDSHGSCASEGSSHDRGPLPRQLPPVHHERLAADSLALRLGRDCEASIRVDGARPGRSDAHRGRHLRHADQKRDARSRSERCAAPARASARGGGDGEGGQRGECDREVSMRATVRECHPSARPGSSPSRVLPSTTADSPGWCGRGEMRDRKGFVKPAPALPKESACRGGARCRASDQGWTRGRRRGLRVRQGLMLRVGLCGHGCRQVAGKRGQNIPGEVISGVYRRRG